MKKIPFYIAVLLIISAVIVPFSTASVSASTYPATCTNLSQNLAYGVYSQDVVSLQQFLISQNYLQTSATGYFGGATLRAVKSYQFDHDIPVTGFVGALTRASIQTQSCGATYPVPTPIYNGGTVSITSLSATSGAVGTYITIYGSGFDAYNNTVNFGNTAISGLSSNGSSISFTVPQITTNTSSCVTNFSNNQYNNFYDPNCNYNQYYNQNISYNVTVVTSHGTSNVLTFMLTTNGNGYNGYGNPTISYVTPTSGSVGTYVTIYGTNFSSTGNTVYLGGTPISNISSYNGTSLSFTIPSQINNYNYQNGTGNYNVHVTNTQGQSSNSVSFYVNSNYNNGNGGLSIVNVNGPTTLGTNNQGTWYVVVNNPNTSYSNVTATWGDSNSNGVNNQTITSQGQQTLTFSHTYYTQGNYTITFTFQDNNGNHVTSSTNVFVNSGYTSNQINLSYLSPTQARVGTQIMIQGTGFTSNGNTVHFGNGGTQNISSNGSTIYYTIPSVTTGCDLSTGGTCATYAQQINPGSYPIFVSNSNGTSNTMYFTVTY